MCVCVYVCVSIIISLCSWVIFVYVDAVYWFYWCSFLMLNWMFQHDCLDTCCFWVSYMHAFSFFFFCTCSAQLSMFHMERRSRNTLIIIIIIIAVICCVFQLEVLEDPAAPVAVILKRCNKEQVVCFLLSWFGGLVVVLGEFFVCLGGGWNSSLVVSTASRVRSSAGEIFR